MLLLKIEGIPVIMKEKKIYKLNIKKAGLSTEIRPLMFQIKHFLLKDFGAFLSLLYVVAFLSGEDVNLIILNTVLSIFSNPSLCRRNKVGVLGHLSSR